MARSSLALTLPTAAALLTACTADASGPDPTSESSTALEALEALQLQRAEALAARPEARAWTRRVLYFALIDRFADGSAALDNAAGDPDCNDPNDAHAFQGGDLPGLQSRLDYIEGLGADALWVTPLYRGVAHREGANCGFPGYWADFADPYTLELDPRYGSETDFDAVIDDAHDRGLRVMLDMVINHAGYDATIVEQHPSWFANPATCANAGAPDIDCPLAGLPDFVHANPEVREYLIDAHLQWVDRFDIDAIRMDTVKHVRPHVFAEWIDAMLDVQPDLYMLGELLDEHTYDRFGPYLDAGFDGLFNFPVRRGLIETFAWGNSTNAIAGRVQDSLQRFGPEGTARMVNLLDNHDVPRFLSEVPWGVPGDEAQERYALAMTALLTMPGIPQIYYGNELGMYGGGDPDNRRFMPSWAFSEDGRDQAHDGFLPHPGGVYDHVHRLLEVRHAYRALQDGGYHELWRQGAPQNNNVWSYIRVPQTSDTPVIVGYNNGALPTNGGVPLSVGAWFEDGVELVDALGSGQTFVVDDGTVALALAARTSVILVPATEPTTDDLVDLTVRVDADTQWGQSVYLTGSTNALGAWDLGDAVSMMPGNCVGTRCRWTTTVSVPSGSSHAYKFVKIDDGLGVRWETGFNRQTAVDGPLALEVANFRE
ncbi:MAG: alpha-amylase family glycosyl hydrolase [Myxococcota bacterium]